MKGPQPGRPAGALLSQGDSLACQLSEAATVAVPRWAAETQRDVYRNGAWRQFVPDQDSHKMITRYYRSTFGHA